MATIEAQSERTFAGLRERSRVEAWLHSVRRFARIEPAGAVAAGAILVLFALVFLGPELVAYDPISLAPSEKFTEPGFATGHWLGTDQLGRDVLSRLLTGGRVSLATAFAAIALGITIGSILGMVTGFFGGWVAQIIERAIDGLMSIPPLVLALAIATALGNNRVNILVAIAIVMVPTSARVVRGATLSVRAFDYVLAARTIGSTNRRVIGRHILPNVFGTIVTVASIWVGAAILIEASLGFVGIGTQPPNPSWGNMLSGEGRSYMVSAPWLAVVPGVAISITVLAFNVLGDSLRSVLDPRSRGRL